MSSKSWNAGFGQTPTTSTQPSNPSSRGAYSKYCTPPSSPRRKKLSLKAIRNVFSNTQSSGDTPRVPPQSPTKQDSVHLRRVGSLFPRITNPDASVQGFSVQTEVVPQPPTLPRWEVPEKKDLPPLPSRPARHCADPFASLSPRVPLVSFHGHLLRLNWRFIRAIALEAQGAWGSCPRLTTWTWTSRPRALLYFPRLLRPCLSVLS